MTEFNLQEVLSECHKSAEIGYEIASVQYKRVHEIILNAEKEIEDTLLTFNSSACYLSDATSSLSEQLSETRSAMNKLSCVFQDDLPQMKDNLNKFSITLFGKTMAGKSTLMEILTHGNGESIGKGSQRTTRDVRSYYWNDLEITDVPGVAAFEGEEDEAIAFEAAKTADLVLFLVTDDGIQASEADCFSQILEMGKPVICIMNVKASASSKNSPKLILKNIEKKFDVNRLNEIREQFYAYAKKKGQNWEKIPFVYVHLQSAFIAQKTDDTALAEAYHQISRIDHLKEEIISQVRTKGKFYRIKNFIDRISNPMINSMEELIHQSLINSAQGRTIFNKIRKLVEWKKDFETASQTRIASCIMNIRSELNASIASFAEDHFADKNAEKAWQSFLLKQRVENRCQEVLKQLEEQCNDVLAEISREINSELTYVTSSINQQSFRVGQIVDGRKMWNWAAIILGGALTIGSLIAKLIGVAALSGPLWLAAVGVGAVGSIGVLLIASKGKQEYEARIRLEQQLKTRVVSLCESLEMQMKKNLELLVQKRIDAVLRELTRIDTVLRKLAATQRKLSWQLDENILELSHQMVREAIGLIGAKELEFHVLSVARIPGTAMTFLLNGGTVFPDEQLKQLTKLTGEFIYFAVDSPDKFILISRVIDKIVDRNILSIDEENGVAHFKVDALSPQLENRVRMAQQLARIAITK